MRHARFHSRKVDKNRTWTYIYIYIRAALSSRPHTRARVTRPESCAAVAAATILSRVLSRRPAAKIYPICVPRSTPASAGTRLVLTSPPPRPPGKMSSASFAQACSHKRPCGVALPWRKPKGQGWPPARRGAERGHCSRSPARCRRARAPRAAVLRWLRLDGESRGIGDLGINVARWHQCRRSL